MVLIPNVLITKIFLATVMISASLCQFTDRDVYIADYNGNLVVSGDVNGLHQHNSVRLKFNTLPLPPDFAVAEISANVEPITDIKVTNYQRDVRSKVRILAGGITAASVTLAFQRLKEYPASEKGYHYEVELISDPEK